jgi:hypothetical protein
MRTYEYCANHQAYHYVDPTSVEEECHRRQKALTWEIRAENAEKKKAEDKAAFEGAVARTLFREGLQWWQQEQREALAEQSAEVKAVMAEAHEQRDQPFKSFRLQLRESRRDREASERQQAQRTG